MNEPLHVLRRVAELFEMLKINYMIVASGAMRAYIPGRSTWNTDILVEMTEEQLAQLADEFGEDWILEWEPARKALRSKCMFNALHYGTSWKLDLIPLKDDAYHAAEFARRRVARINDVSCYVQSLEDLILSKLHWAKRGGSKRQVEDVGQLLRAGLEIDRSYLQKWSAELGLDTLVAEAESA